MRTLLSPLGDLVAVAEAAGVTLLEFHDQRGLERQLEALGEGLTGTPSAVVQDGDAGRHLDQLERELREYFDGARTRFEVAVAPSGTPFQRDVWAGLRRIPYGATQSYGALAASIGRPKAVRAVGRANGENRVAILIPCHRCVGAGGALTGYAGGLWRKERLLALERGTAARP